ncbi:MAG: A24 family peptidase C-terminal domain-containing protein [Euryarchaeota archaeon]|nr:A24 family peptidase C-terminal domain-containing protein [Euryarchaeota archaeon]
MIRVVPVIILLLYSCIEDLKKREVEDWVWLVMIAVGILFGVYDYTQGVSHELIAESLTIIKIIGLFIAIYTVILLLNRESFKENIKETPYILAFLGFSSVMFFAPNPFNVIFQNMSITFVLVYFITFFGMMGGGDGKALIALSSLFFGREGTLPVFSISVLNNSLILVVFLPLVLFFYNLIKRNKFENIEGQRLAKIRTYFTGYQISLKDLDEKSFPLMACEDGQLKLQSAVGVIEYDVDGYKEDISPYAERIWVTPGLPFLIPITLGFLTAYFYGDLIFKVLFHLF